MNRQKAFSAIVIKSFNEDAREIEGIASTPAPDRVQDIVEPLGLSFEDDAPLLLNHDPSQPVGTVQFGAATPQGLPFKAKIAKVEEPGIVKDRTDEAWHSVKARLIKGVSIGFLPKEAESLGVGKGIHYKKAAVHELSLVSIPCNPQAVITAFKSLHAAETGTGAISSKPQDVSISATKTTIKGIPVDTTNHTLRTAIANAIYGGPVKEAQTYATRRWGADSSVTKAFTSPIGTAQAQSLVLGTGTRDDFVQAVFTQSILGRLPGLVLLPPDVRVNVEVAPIVAPFVAEGAPTPAFGGNFDVKLASRRKVAAIVALSAELLRATDAAAESVMSGLITRALSRGIDSALSGTQTDSASGPAGLLSAAGTLLTSFNEAVDAFAGDFATTAVLVHPRTAVRLRSPQEQSITATGGTYGGMPVITSISVPVGTMILLDGARVIASIGKAELDPTGTTTLDVDDGTGTSNTVLLDTWTSSLVGLRARQYVDWKFVDGAAVACTVTA